MGATNFETVSLGKDAGDAFRSAVADARHEYGHGGYTGTIAEKDGFTVFGLPAGVTARELMGWVEKACYSIMPEGLPAEHRALVMEMAGVYNDKWGPAVCLELSRDPGGVGTFLFAGFASE